MANKDYRGTNYPLGIRNNNPGNLRPTGQQWQGQVGTNQNFMVFSDIVYGTRALGTDLTNKFYRGLNTVRKIIDVYAPPSENNTAAYISAISNSLNIGADTPITNWSKDFLSKFMRAIIMHENGEPGSLVTDQEIIQGIGIMSPNLLLKVKGF
jgi:hypothetical protein